MRTLRENLVTYHIIGAKMEGKILARHRKMLSVALQQNNFTLDLWWKDAYSPTE